MSIHSFSELGELFGNQSKDIWERLGYVRDSYKSRGVLGPVRFGEETITDLLMLGPLCPRVYTGPTSNRLPSRTKPCGERTSNCGWGFEEKRMVPIAIQAKKLDLRTDRYSSLTQANSNGPQIELLEDYARLNRAAPLYCLYNHTDGADEFKHWHCCTGPAT